MQTPEGIDIPEPPDMSPLVQAYQTPTAPFDQDSVEELLQKAQDTFQTFNDFGALKPLLEAFLGSDTEQSSSALALTGQTETSLMPVDVGGQEVQGDGYLEIERICAGWNNATLPSKEENGYVHVIMVFHDTGIEAVVWGEAVECKYLVDGQQLLLDGEVRIHTGEILQSLWASTASDPQQTQALELLVDFDGTMKLGEEVVASEFNFKFILSQERAEFSLETPQGNLLFFLEETQQGFIGSNGTWICNFNTRTCEQR